MINQKLEEGLFKSGMFAVLLLVVAACGSTPPRLPSAVEQAKKADQSAHRAMHDGDLPRAAELFKQAMLIHQSVENIPAATTAAINLSSVMHKLGDDATALGLLNTVLADNTSAVSSDLRAAAAFRKGIILIDRGSNVEAESAIQLAKQECKQKCEFEPGIDNLQARLSLGKGDFAAALAFAKNGMNSNVQKEERANAQRIAAAAEAALGRYEIAFTYYQGALELDKELALSKRIVEDLKGISRVLESLGRKQEAEIFARRAEAVTMSAQELSVNKPGKIIP